ncbi:SusD family protein [Pedobacter sp. ok626]|uniref:RagB/SusD family nutrient uptake outer membrane protein n=1 Tax=Pedobacter sp. ok626 TaxID=1761882 RepID=UPI000880335B|nr:RagB/SusD family nutrient uptake outer membrane protein [Pedobacter sp. ok626]SDL65950.1 SusD family protein [Pedobacter sp. ok626]
MKFKNTYFFLLMFTLMLTSCKKFLEENSQDLSYANSAADLSELLVGEGYLGLVEGNSYSMVHLMDDDSEENVMGSGSGNPLGTYEGFHLWAQKPFIKDGVPVTDLTWKDIYHRIAVINTVYEEVERFKTSDPEGYRKVKGESAFLRAGYYFALVNLYAKPFSQVTAETDLGVPLKLTNYIEDKKYTRATVAEVYIQIVADLELAATNLSGIQQPTVYRANEAAAHAMLGRVYLFTGKWDQALTEYNKVINSAHSLLNLNSYTNIGSFTYAGSPETIFSQGGNFPNNIFYPYSNSYKVAASLRESYTQGDLRPIFFFIEQMNWQDGTTFYNVNKLASGSIGSVSSEFLIRLPEVYLGKAEAQAMLDQPADAITTLQNLRRTRFKDGNAGSINLSGEALVNFIRNERRLELCFEGFRWFDLRRYAVSSKYPVSKEILHKKYAYSTVSRKVEYVGTYRLGTYLEENGGGYVLPLPDAELTINNGTLINNERPLRQIMP